MLGDSSKVRHSVVMPGPAGGASLAPSAPGLLLFLFYQTTVFGKETGLETRDHQSLRLSLEWGPSREESWRLTAMISQIPSMKRCLSLAPPTPLPLKLSSLAC